jgi:hypothetical protein
VRRDDLPVDSLALSQRWLPDLMGQTHETLTGPDSVLRSFMATSLHQFTDLSLRGTLMRFGEAGVNLLASKLCPHARSTESSRTNQHLSRPLCATSDSREPGVSSPIPAPRTTASTRSPPRGASSILPLQRAFKAHFDISPSNVRATEGSTARRASVA